MVALFNGNPSTTIICSNPNNARDEKDLDTYNKLSSLVYSLPKHNILFIRGDMTAQIGKKQKQQIQLTQHQTEMETTKQISHLKMNQHAWIQNFRKVRRNYGSTLMQIMLKNK